MATTATVPQAFREHFLEALEKVNSLQREYLLLQGEAAEKMTEKKAMEKHLSLLLTAVSRSLGIPADAANIRLDKTCTTISYEVRNGVAE